MLKIKKNLSASNINVSLAKSSFIALNILSLNIKYENVIRLPYSSLKFLALFNNINPMSLKFPLRVFFPTLNNLKIFFLSKLLLNTNVRYLTFLFDNVNSFIFLHRSCHKIFLFLVQLTNNVYYIISRI